MDKISIVAKGLGCHRAPDTGEVWGINDAIMKRRFTKLFHMHDLRDIDEALKLKMIESEIPIITLRRWPGIPNSRRYPIERIIDHFQRDYFTSSVDYMLAYAILTGMADTIDMYGVNMHIMGEYGKQKGSCEYWIARAEGAGIKVNVHGKYSEVLKAWDRKLYGYDVDQGNNIGRAFDEF